MHLAHERHHVVLAQRGEGDVTHHHHLVVVGGKGDGEMSLGIVVHARGHFLVHGGDPTWRGSQALAPRVLAHGLDQLSHETLDTSAVDGHDVGRSVDRDGALVDPDVRDVAIALGDVEPVAHHEIRGMWNPT